MLNQEVNTLSQFLPHLYPSFTVELYDRDMIAAIIVILAVLWFFGYIRIEGFTFPDIQLFVINGERVTLLDALILLIVMWAISILPTPFREVSGVLLILWVLAVLGVISIAGIGLPSILILAIIVGLIVSLFSHSRTRNTEV